MCTGGTVRNTSAAPEESGVGGAARCGPSDNTNGVSTFKTLALVQRLACSSVTLFRCFTERDKHVRKNSNNDIVSVDGCTSAAHVSFDLLLNVFN